MVQLRKKNEDGLGNFEIPRHVQKIDYITLLF